MGINTEWHSLFKNGKDSTCVLVSNFQVKGLINKLYLTVYPCKGVILC